MSILTDASSGHFSQLSRNTQAQHVSPAAIPGCPNEPRPSHRPGWCWNKVLVMSLDTERNSDRPVKKKKGRPEYQKAKGVWQHQ